MKRLVSKARVLVTDGAQALVLRNDGDVTTPDLQLVRSYAQENPPTREQGAERPGRTNIDRTRRSAVETSDWHELAEAEFVATIAADMDRDLRAGEFESLVVVAAPVALGNYRRAASAALAAATVIEIAKDLVNHPHSEIAAIVMKELDAS